MFSQVGLPAALALLNSAVLAASPPTVAGTYDFVIVGGGTSGLVVAGRLSEDPNVSVAVIEAGGSVINNTNVSSIYGYGTAFGTDIDWAYESVPQTYAGNGKQTLRAGKALGGSSTINGMVYMRAETSQIDALGTLGNNISWNTLLPYYKKSEHFQLPTDNQTQAGASYVSSAHGMVGPVLTGWPTQMIDESFQTIINNTASVLKIPWNADANNGDMRGFSVSQLTVNTAESIREDAARAYYYPAASRPNLHVYLNAFATSMTWMAVSGGATPVANGVIFRNAAGQTKRLVAKKEVILSAGALRSPLILELSGVGNPTILSKFGINTTVSLPAVGESLQDQVNFGLTFGSSRSFSGLGASIIYANAHDVFGDKLNNIKQTVSKAIPGYAKRAAQASGGAISRAALQKLFQLQHKIIFTSFATIAETVIVPPSGGGSAAIDAWGLMPFSRGNVHISSANPTAPATINPNYLMLGWDVLQSAYVARGARGLAYNNPLAQLYTAEASPGLSTVPANATDDQWISWIRGNYRSNFHYISTAAMMPRGMGGVVDSNHVVYGTANVRVVDASVLPFQVSGHLTSTLYALAERASDLIKAKYS